MRVIAGTARGRKLVAPHGLNTRPTPGRVREALFSIIAAHLHGAQVLDLFAGTGALGIEALSRGAAHATFVERDRRALAALQKNCEVFGSRVSLMAQPVNAALAQLQKRNARYDIVFMDPPYAMNLGGPTLAILAAGAFLDAAGVVVCEHSGSAPPPQAPSGWELLRGRAFGDVAIALYGPAEGQSP